MTSGPRRSAWSLGAPFALFLLSGFPGLVYQVVWVRQLGQVFGNTVAAAALTTGVFVLGLGLGSWAMGRVADRRHAAQPRWAIGAYGASELGIAALALVLLAVVPRLPAWSALASSYAQDAAGYWVLTWGSWLARYLAAGVLLFPATFLMGGTLALLARYVVGSEASHAGWRIGLLYGLNTLGAAAGAFFSDAVLIPSGGITSTLHWAIAANLVCAAGALVLLLRTRGGAAPAEAAPVEAEPSPALERARSWAGLGLLLSGFSAMGMEILWFRHLSCTLGEFRSVFSLLVTLILLGIWLGALGGAWLGRRGRPATWLMLAQAALVATSLLGLALAQRTVLGEVVAAHRSTLQGASAALRPWVLRAFLIRAMLGVVGVPALLMGFAFPLANAHLQRFARDVGGTVGRLYLWNTVGDVLGASLTGFLLLPRAGIQSSALILASVALASLLPFYLSAREAPGPRESPAGQGRGLVGAALLGVAAASAFAVLPKGYLMRGMAWRQDRLIDLREGENEVLAVAEGPGGDRTLMTNGHAMSGTTFDALRYMRLFAHLPLLQLDSPRSALIICFGVGNTAHAVALHPVERIDIADLSRNVLDHAPFFAQWNAEVLRDPRVHVYLNDGRHHLLMQPPATYDLVTLEPPPISQAGVSALYSEEFYRLAKSRLRPGGFITQWLPAYQVSGTANLEMIRAFVEVFPESVLLSGAGSELVLMGRAGAPIALDLAALSRNLSARPGVEANLAEVSLGSLTELVGTFVASGSAMRRATSGVRAVTDDWPSIEYDQVSPLLANRLGVPVDLAGLGEWCPGCRDAAGRPVPLVADLDPYLRLMQAYYRSDQFLAFSNDPAVPPPPPLPVPTDPDEVRALAAHRYAQLLFR